MLSRQTNALGSHRLMVIVLLCKGKSNNQVSILRCISLELNHCEIQVEVHVDNTGPFLESIPRVSGPCCPWCRGKQSRDLLQQLLSVPRDPITPAGLQGLSTSCHTHVFEVVDLQDLLAAIPTAEGLCPGHRVNLHHNLLLLTVAEERVLHVIHLGGQSRSGVSSAPLWFHTVGGQAVLGV